MSVQSFHSPVGLTTDKPNGAIPLPQRILGVLCGLNLMQSQRVWSFHMYYERKYRHCEIVVRNEEEKEYYEQDYPHPEELLVCCNWKMVWYNFSFFLFIFFLRVY